MRNPVEVDGKNQNGSVDNCMPAQTLKTLVMIDFEEASIYVGTYAKYNDGSLEGKWMKLSEYDSLEEFYEACHELHSDEEDPELMFQDHENIPEQLVGESWLSPNFFQLRTAMEDLPDGQTEAFVIWLQNEHFNQADGDVNEQVENFQDSYQGKFEDDEDFAWEIVNEHYDLSDFAKTYFDYAKFARDLFLGDYWSHDGHVFRS